jgi:cell division protein FtsI/penicillin-binding protein 2
VAKTPEEKPLSASPATKDLSRTSDLRRNEAQATPQLTWRLWLVVAGLGLLTAVVVARLLHHQLVGWLTSSPLRAEGAGALPRGVMVDRHGELLAADRFFYSVTADPFYLKSDEERQTIADRLEQLLGLPTGETRRKLAEASKFHYVGLAKQVSLADGQKLIDFVQTDADENGISLLRYVQLEPFPVRYYPQATLASQVMGFVKADGNGVYGLEGYYNSFLDSRIGIGLLEKTQDNLSVLAPKVRRFVPSMSAKDLVLTLDIGVQWIIEDELQRALQQYQAVSGTIIVMDPHTGAILGLANSPAYDPNHYNKAQDFSRFINPAISLQYEPGSIFKVVTMAAALDTGIITPTTMYTDSGSVTVGSRVIFNSNRVGYGLVSATEALARSLNVVTAQIAEQLGKEQFYRYIQRFGFGELSEIDLAGEVGGLIKAPGNPDWSLSDLGTNSFGQGVAVTPIQMLNAVCVIANGGRLYRPYVVQARIEREQVLVTRPTLVRTVLQPHSAQLLTEMMVETVRSGNAAAGVSGYTVAGKSGTAQIPGEGGYLQDATIVSFVGFAPADDPQFAVLIKLDRPDPNISQWATHTAAPVFGQVARRLFGYLNIPPDVVRLGKTTDK